VGLFSLLTGMKIYKTPEAIRLRAKQKRDAIKTAGGAEYEALLAKEKAKRTEWRRANPEKIREYDRRYEREQGIPFKTALCASARWRGRKRGLDATITPSDLDWPTHCPVLGIELDYPERSGQRKDLRAKDSWPSLDRWDNTKGYVPGNVFVISMRANTLKGMGNLEEFLKVLAYLRDPPRVRCSEVPRR
jgi:hypothetical protein